jgi:hypothetical protein
VLRALDPVAHLWRGTGRAGPKMPQIAQIILGRFLNYYKAKSVELTGFEPVTPSLRKMRSKRSDQAFQGEIAVLWRGCGTSHARCRETG